MSKEREKYRFLRYVDRGTRAITALAIAPVMTFAPDSPPAPKFSPTDQRISQPLETPQVEAQTVDPTQRATKNLARYMEDKDLAKIRANLDERYPSWRTYGDNNYPSGWRGVQNVIDLFKQSFEKRGAPKCLGYTQTGPNHKYTGVLFENFGVLPGMSGSSMVLLLIDPRIDEIANDPLAHRRIIGVEEVLSKDLNKVKEMITPCTQPQAPQKPPEQPVQKPEQKVELPKDVPTGKIVYKVSTDGETNVSLSNIDGTDEKILVENEKIVENVIWLPDGKRIAYYVFRKGIMVRNIKTNEVIQVTHPNTDKEFDTCLAPDRDDRIIFSRYGQVPGVNNSEDIFSVKTDGTDLQQLTDDRAGNSEHCPVVSRDGKYIAFRVFLPGRHSGPDGIAIWERDKIGDFDYKNNPVLFDGNDVVDWSPDSQFLLFKRQVNLPPPKGYRFDLYKIKPDGTGETKIVEDAEGGSWSPDGKWIVYSSRKGDGKNLDLYLTSEGLAAPIRLSNTTQHEFAPSWQPEPKKEIKITGRSVALFLGMLTEIEDGYEKHKVTENFENWMVNSLGYARQSLLRFSTNGGVYDENGDYKARNQSCAETLTDPGERADKGVIFINDALAHRPNDELVIITHSEGSIPLIRAMQKVKDGQAKVDMNRIKKIIFISGPLHGVDKPILDRLGSIRPIRDLESCRTLFGITPPPALLNTPSGDNLIKLWDNRKARDTELSELTAWLKGKGVSVFSLFNDDDCIISFRRCLVPEELLEIEYMKGKVLEIERTQEMPGAINIERSLGTEDLGHTSYWKTEEGLAILTTIVGPQIGR